MIVCTGVEIELPTIDQSTAEAPDIGLPDMDGYEVARHLRQQPQTKDVWLTAMTGYGRDSDRQHSQEAGFDHHLVKPADPQKLQDLLATLAKQPRFAK